MPTSTATGHDIGLSIDDQGDGSSVPAPMELPSPGTLPSPTVIIYDNYPGGIGFSRPLFDMHRDLLEKTRDLVAGGPCESGCPSCVGPEGHTGPFATVASRILDVLLEL